MNEARRFPFGGIPVYNPLSLSKEEALAQFYARQTTYASLMELLREERPSHVLLIGARGMGKTTLLQRVRYGVEDDPELGGRYLVLAFPEEQFNVNRLQHFLLNAVDALADAAERLHNARMLGKVEEFTHRAGRLSLEEIKEAVPQFLAEISTEMKRNLLLLVDNADRLFETIDPKEQWTLREMLSTRRDLTLFGATTQASEGIYGPERAFFEFFKVYPLAPLTLEEVRALLLRLSESVEEKATEKGAAKRRVEEWLASDAARLRTLVYLTGGNPRTTVLLFHLVLDGLDGGAREYLEQLLDQCTPNYKGRVDELPAQAQQVLDAVALKWDPVTAMEIAEETRLETNAVSTHLTRLVRQGILEKADPGDSKKALYQVAERFFNIWYLMRASRRVRAKLRWFVEFLRVFHDSDELENMAWERLESFRGARRAGRGEVETAFAYVLASRADRTRVEEYLRRECAEMEIDWRPYLDAIRSASDALALHGVSDASRGTRPIDEGTLRNAIEREPGKASHWIRLGNALAQRPESLHEAESAIRTAIDLDANSVNAWIALGSLLNRTAIRREEAVASLGRATELNPKSGEAWATLGAILTVIGNRRDEAQAALLKALELDLKSSHYYSLVGNCLGLIRECRQKAEFAHRRAIDLEPKSSAPWKDLGDLLARIPGRGEEAEAAYRTAVDLDPKSWGSWDGLAGLLANDLKRMGEAEVAYRNAIELCSPMSATWHGYGKLLARAAGREEEAEAALRKAIDIDPDSATSWRALGLLLAEVPERGAQAEAAYRKAIELDPQVSLNWLAFGLLLFDVKERSMEAEAAFRKAIEIDPKRAWYWAPLGLLLSRAPARSKEAEAVLRKAVELEPGNGITWRSLGFFLACLARKPEDAATALREAVRLDPDEPGPLRDLGVLLFCELSKQDEAVDCLRRASELDPANLISKAILAACAAGTIDDHVTVVVQASRRAEFWNELLDLYTYAPFGKIFLRICGLIQDQDKSNPFAPLFRAVALAQLGDFPRASVALDDALAGDPIELLASSRNALEVFFAAAVRSGRVQDCIELLDRREWKDAWRPIYEALKAVEAGSAEYLKRIAVEIRIPASEILHRIAPELPSLA